MSYFKSCHGYCPEFERHMDIEVIFSEVPIMGSEPQFRQFSFECDFLEDCKTAGPNGSECPVFKNAVY